MWRLDDPQGNEAGKVKYDIVAYTRGKGVDIGCGPSKAFPHFVGIDSRKDTGLFGIQMEPDVVVEDACSLPSIESESLDFVFSSHLLEHIPDTKVALTEWWRILKVGGHLVLYLPHRDHYPNIGQFGSNPDHKHDFTEDDIREVMGSVGDWTLRVEEVRSGGTEYSFLQVFQKRDDGLQIIAIEPRPEKAACVVRYGGFGDSIQAAGILPELKRMGYHVTFMTTPRGHEILKNDPHIDRFLLQDDDQVPNHELPLYWAAQAKRFDRFINLSESIEGTLLAYPGRANHSWPHAVRLVELDKNYHEWTAQLAEVAFCHDARFYPTDAEVTSAKGYLARSARRLLPDDAPMLMPSPDAFHILWCLAGSSVHKFYPGQDVVVKAVLDHIPEAIIHFTGDPVCKILEAGWEDNRRVRCLSGEIGIRESLALAQQSNCVVGPETGTLNAVAFEPMGKVVLMSHSSPHNLTKHWYNTASIVPENTPCYPCHQMHMTRDFCPEDADSGASICQRNIDPGVVFEAIRAHYLDWRNLIKIRRAA